MKNTPIYNCFHSTLTHTFLYHDLQASEICSLVMEVLLTSLGRLHWTKGTSSSNNNFDSMDDSFAWGQ